jgi:uncharacterized RDD family membrane protein YckC
MNYPFKVVAFLVLAFAGLAPASTFAQLPDTLPKPPEVNTQMPPGNDRAPQVITEMPSVEDQYVWRRPVFRIGSDYELAAGDAVRSVAVVYGDVSIAGRVNRDVVVVFGKVELATTAQIDGSMTVVGGHAIISPGAQVGQELFVIASELDAPPDFTPAGGSVVIGSKAFGGAVEAIVPWITRGLLWGRPLVPGLPWVWGVLAIFFFLYLALNLIFDRPVQACAEMLAARPLTSFGAGILVLLLLGPVCVLLGVSIIGIAIIPFVLFATIGAWIIGRVGVARWIGSSAVPQASAGSRLESTRSFVIGFAVITVAYMLPIVGLVTWASVGVLGLGSAWLAFLAAYRRENPPVARPARAERVAPPEPPDVPGPAGPVGRVGEIAHGGISMMSETQSDASDRRFEPPPAPAIPMSPAMTGGVAVASDLATFPRADFRDRAAGAVLDVIVVILMVNLLAPILPAFGNDDMRTFLFALLVYHVWFWTAKATTVGGIIFQLRVVRADGTPMRFADSLVRGLSGLFSVAVVGLGFFWMLKDPEKQTWHDKIAGTYVVKVPRNWAV